MSFPPYLNVGHLPKERIEEMKDYELPKLPSLNQPSYYAIPKEVSCQTHRSNYTYHPNYALPPKLPKLRFLSQPNLPDNQSALKLNYPEAEEEGVKNPLASPCKREEKLLREHMHRQRRELQERRNSEGEFVD
jgi:hypothetical protein